MVVGAGMGGLGLMILFVGCLSTGDTRNRVYRTWRGRVGGRISCAIVSICVYLPRCRAVPFFHPCLSTLALNVLIDLACTALLSNPFQVSTHLCGKLFFLMSLLQVPFLSLLSSTVHILYFVSYSHRYLNQYYFDC